MEVGKTVYGDYELIKPIGKGKFAVVYRAKRLSDGDTVALKRISVDTIDAKARDKCLKEVRLLQALDHPNVIKYLDSFITDDDLVIVVEWAAAGDLKRQLRKAQERGVGFEEKIIWKYFSQMASAMQHLRDKRIMHRDLKPANIFLTLDGTVKVGDLGLSRELSEHTIQAHSKVGTPLYMSPEVLRGDGYDFKSDIWSLGCLLYELAMLKSPFKSEGLNLYSLFQKISQGDYQPLPEQYSVELKELAYAMISTNPEDRPDIGDVCKVASKMRAAYASQKSSKKESGVSDEKSVTSNNNATDSPDTNGYNSATADPKDRYDTSDYPAKDQLANNDAEDDDRTVNNNVDRNNYNGDHGADKVRGSSAARRESDDYNSNDNGISGNGLITALPKSSSGWSEVDYSKKESTSRPAPAKSASPQPILRHKNLSLEAKAAAAATTTSTLKKREPSSSSRSRGGHTALEAVLPPSDGGSTSAPDAMNKLQASSEAFALMSVLYGKLVALGCPLDDPTVKTDYMPRGSAGRGTLFSFHFACDISLLGNLAGHDKGRGGAHTYFQFRRMAQVAMWLFEVIASARPSANKVSRIELDSDTPLMIAKQLLNTAIAVGVPSVELGDISPPALTLGYGERVCSFLLILTDFFIKVSNRKSKPLVYAADEFMDVGDRADDDEDEDDDVIEEGEGSGDYRSKNPLNNVWEGSEGGSGALVESAHAMVLLGAIDPVLWCEETERVATQLMAAKVRVKSGADTGWEGHLQRIKEYVGEQASEKGSTSRLLPHLRALSADIEYAVASIKKTENILNNGPMSRLREEYCTYRKRYDAYKDVVTRGAQRLEQLTGRASELDEMLDDLREQTESKAGGANGSDAASGITRMKEAIRKVKQENVDMDLHIGLLANQIMHKKVENARLSRKSSRKGRNNKLDDVSLGHDLEY